MKYIWLSESGDDKNSGLSQAQAVRTPSRANKLRNQTGLAVWVDGGLEVVKRYGAELEALRAEWRQPESTDGLD